MVEGAHPLCYGPASRESERFEARVWGDLGHKSIPRMDPDMASASGQKS